MVCVIGRFIAGLWSRFTSHSSTRFTSNDQQSWEKMASRDAIRKNNMTNKELQDKSTSTFCAKIIKDSINECGNRLTTFEVTYPRLIHAEMCRHRIMSRNSASSRAIPVLKMLKAVTENPFVPFHWGKAQEGMQAYEELSPEGIEECRNDWIQTRDECIKRVQRMLNNGLHKQIANRPLEPWFFVTEVISTTSFEHFRRLRDSESAEPHIRFVAKLMTEARNKSTPTLLCSGMWHLPYIYEEDIQSLGIDDLKKISTARCAAVSYVRQNEKKEYAKDFALHDRLKNNGHSSPFEHVATPYIKTEYVDAGLAGGYYEHRPRQSANFLGWKQYRKEIPNEFVRD